MGVESGPGHNPETEATEDETEDILAKHRNNESMSDKDLADLLNRAADQSRGSETWHTHEQDK